MLQLFERLSQVPPTLNEMPIKGGDSTAGNVGSENGGGDSVAVREGMNVLHDDTEEVSATGELSGGTASCKPRLTRNVFTARQQKKRKAAE